MLILSSEATKCFHSLSLILSQASLSPMVQYLKTLKEYEELVAIDIKVTDRPNDRLKPFMISYLILSYLILSYLILSYLILSYLILSYLILSYLGLS